jgi:hypothetical protein
VQSVKIIFLFLIHAAVARSFFLCAHTRLHVVCVKAACDLRSALLKPRRRSSGRSYGSLGDLPVVRVISMPSALSTVFCASDGAEFMTQPCEVWLVAGERRQQSCLFFTVNYRSKISYHSIALRRIEASRVGQFG